MPDFPVHSSLKGEFKVNAKILLCLQPKLLNICRFLFTFNLHKTLTYLRMCSFIENHFTFFENHFSFIENHSILNWRKLFNCIILTWLLFDTQCNISNGFDLFFHNQNSKLIYRKRVWEKKLIFFRHTVFIINQSIMNLQEFALSDIVMN